MEGTPKKEPAGLSPMAEQLEKYIGPYCGDVFDTALRLFSNIAILKQTGVYITSQFDRMAFGFNDEGEPYVFIDPSNDIVSPRLRKRIIKRFELPDDLFGAPKGVFMPFVLAHELGHAIQADEAFFDVFGGEMDVSTLSPEDNYDAYVQSDKEVNADYIAAVIVSHSRLGQETGMVPPRELAYQWREWAQAHQLSLADLQ